MKKDMDLKRERWVYSITCPITKNIIYIGITNNPKNRFKAHIREAKKNNGSLLYFYLFQILKRKQSPIFEVIDRVFLSYTESEYKEAEYIEKRINTVLNEMYGNGKRIKENQDLKKELKEMSEEDLKT